MGDGGVDANGVALVTGAGRGLGRAVALELCARGFEVVATMRNPGMGAGLVDEAATAGGALRVERLDVTEPESIAIPDGLRVLVNNAGVEVPHPPFEDTPLDMWRHMFETNVFGLIEVTRRAIPEMRDSGGGVVCNITSSSLFAPVPFYAPYRASKAAVSVLGESLRTELAPFGIRVLEVMPGPIDTDMLEGSNRPADAVDSPDYAAIARRMYEGRKGKVAAFVTQPADAARMIADAILDDDAPLRVGCDPLGIGMLSSWRSTSDEELMKPMMAAWLFDPD
jgi:NAD(P)-dependent dehydrogenase (short-subunit alcohol dehydrogenase family)